MTDRWGKRKMMEGRVGSRMQERETGSKDRVNSTFSVPRVVDGRNNNTILGPWLLLLL